MDIISATLLSGVISGFLTLGGVVLTIRHQTQKDKTDYLQRIKPFVVIEPTHTFKEDIKSIKKVHFENDSLRESPSHNYVVYRLYEALLCNVGESVCIIDYIKINGHKYKALYSIPIKPNDYCEITGEPVMLYTANSRPDVFIGISDRLFNQYEYKINVEFKEPDEIDSKPKGFVYRAIQLNSIDCRPQKKM